MPAVSEEDLQQLQEENEKLREKLANAQAKRSEQESAREREYQATMLAAENLKLQAQVEAAEEAAKVGSTKSGAAAVQGAAEEQLAQAKAVLESSNKPAPEAPAGKNGGN